MAQIPFKILESRVGWGEIAIGGLGYDAVQSIVVARHSLDEISTISAHAPSLVVLESSEWLEITGLMNCTCYLDRTCPVEFWADWNYVGVGYGPGDETRPIVLPPGRHELRAMSLGANDCGRHSVWTIRQAEPLPLQRLAIITAAQYPLEKVSTELRLFAGSARKQNILLHVFGAGEKFVNMTDTKIARMRGWIESLPPHYDHVLFADTDAAILGSEAEMMERFAPHEGGILIGGEQTCWPIYDQGWKDVFARTPYKRDFINSGVWIGERAIVRAALDALLEIHGRLCGQDSVGLGDDNDCSMPWKHRWWQHSDQFLWQCAFRLKTVPIAIDSSFSLAAHVFAEDNRLDDEGAFQFSGGRIIDKQSGSRPSIVHFQGPAKPYYHQWVGRLGAIE